MISKIAKYLKKTKTYDFIVFTLFGYLDIGWVTGHKCKPKHIMEMKPLLKPCDILHVTNTKAITQFFIEGKWNHVGIFLGHDKGVLEMVGDGIRLVTLEEFLAHVDIVKISRCTKWDTDYQKIMVDIGINFLLSHVPYDKGFEAGTQRMYCSELIYFMDIESRAGFEMKPLPIIGDLGVMPDDLLESKHLITVYELL